MSIEILAPSAVVADNPFPGLRPFEEHEAERFFGREGDISELLSRLRHMRFLAVVGASGCGKSSLIRAGLIASLRDGGLPGEWRVASLRPWQSPVAHLAAALSGPDALDVLADSPEQATAMVKAILQKGSLGIVEAFHRYPLAGGERLLILVDQFEELFTFVRDVGTAAACDEARAFVKLLVEVLAPEYEGLPVYVALTMRSDHLGECALYPGLAEAINNGLYLLPRMEREQLRDAIKEPVEAAGGAISERLADTLINDLKEGTDHLPILQHAMMRLWNQWRQDGGAKIDFDHYKKMGELSTALCKHAEEVYAALDPQQRPIAEAVFRSITRVKDGKVVRRQTKLGVVRKSPRLRGVPFEDVESVLDAFRIEGRSFLVPPLAQKPGDEKQPLDDETAIDISHESLIRQWDRLNGWAMEEATSREVHRRITELASVWANKGRQPDYLIWGANLFEASDWTKNNPDALNELENEFIIASQDAYEKEQLELKPKKEAAEKLAADGAAQADSIKKGSAKVFLAYARKERPFAERLREAFREVGEETLIDWDVLAASEFQEQVSAAIEAADTFVFLISPASAQSSFCVQELQHAARQHKRIVPVVVLKVEEWKLPEELKKEHWIRFDDGTDFGAAFERLREAIKSDLVWVQAHTRLLVRATDWEKRERDENVLLRGHDLSDAEQWLGKDKLEPRLTPLQTQYIIASRAYATRLQNEATKRQRRLFIGALLAGLVLLTTAAFAGYAAWEARRQEAKAEEAKANADTQRVEAEKQKARADEESKMAQEAARIAGEQRQKAEDEKRIAERAVQEAERQKKEAERQKRLALEVAAREKAISAEKERDRHLGMEAARISGEFFTQVYGSMIREPSATPTPTPTPRNEGEEVEKLIKTFNDLAGIYNELKFYEPAYVLLSVFQEDVYDDIGVVDPKLAESVLSNYVATLRAMGKHEEAAKAERRLKEFLARPKVPPRSEKK